MQRRQPAGGNHIVDRRDGGVAVDLAIPAPLGMRDQLQALNDVLASTSVAVISRSFDGTHCGSGGEVLDGRDLDARATSFHAAARARGGGARGRLRVELRQRHGDRRRARADARRHRLGAVRGAGAGLGARLVGRRRCTPRCTRTGTSITCFGIERFDEEAAKEGRPPPRVIAHRGGAAALRSLSADGRLQQLHQLAPVLAAGGVAGRSSASPTRPTRRS